MSIAYISTAEVFSHFRENTPKTQTSAKIEYALLILGSAERLIKIVGVEGVKNSTMLNQYGWESVGLRGANPHKDMLQSGARSK